MTTTVKLPFRKATKNTYQYHAEDKDAVSIDTLYIKQGVFGDTPPPFIEITVKGVDQ